MDDGVQLISPSDLTASQSVTFQMLNFDFNEAKVRDKVIASCKWVGLQQRETTEGSEALPPSDTLLVLPARVVLAAESSIAFTTMSSILSDAAPNALTVPPLSYAASTTSSSKRAKHPLLKEERKRCRISTKEDIPDSEQKAELFESHSNDGGPDNTPNCS